MLYYLACPYTSCPDGPRTAFESANSIAAELMSAGMNIYSPVTHSHPLVPYLGEECRFDHDFWLGIDKIMVDKCDALIVCCLPGWRESRGMRQEIEWFRDSGKPIKALCETALMQWETMGGELAPYLEDYDEL
jgi:hypothetical protein